MRRPLLALLVVGCSSPAVPTPAPVEVPAFDLARVKSTWSEDCESRHDVTDKQFCADVQISGMSAEGAILNVPTKLSSEERNRNRAQDIYRLLAFAHFDTEGRDLGYQFIGIFDSAGGNPYACSISPN